MSGDGRRADRDVRAGDGAPLPGFRNAPIGDMVALGTVRPRRVRLWIHSSKNDPLEVYLEPEGGSARRFELPLKQAGVTTATLPPAAEPGLRPFTRHRYRVVRPRDGTRLGDGSFETAPEPGGPGPERFAIALWSCHQPFDLQGRVREDVEPMLRATRACFEGHRVKQVLEMGDQMYTDYPSHASLFDPDYFPRVAPPGRNGVLDCTPDEVHELLRRRYRHFWNVDGWRRLHAEIPGYPIWDDHELVDNWGSAPAHREPEWASFFQGARAAYAEFQGSRVLEPGDRLPDSFDYALEYDGVAIFVMDLRSERCAGEDGRIHSDAQGARLDRFLEENAARPVIFIVLSVPLVHLPRYAAKLSARLTPSGEDFSDRWSTGAHVRDRDRLLARLHRHQQRSPAQRIVLLSGDIHIGCVHEVAWTDGTRPFFQMISSGITHRIAPLTQLASKLSVRLNRWAATGGCGLAARVRLLPGVPGARRNPFGRLNVGLVEVERGRAAGGARLRFLLYGHRGDEPVCAYRSPWV